MVRALVLTAHLSWPQPDSPTLCCTSPVCRRRSVSPPPSPRVLIQLWPRLVHPLTQAASTAHTEAKEAFALFDKRGAGTIPASSLGDVLRALGQNPTQAQVAELAASVNNQDIDFNTFINILNRPGGYDPAGTAGEFSCPSPLTPAPRAGALAPLTTLLTRTSSFPAMQTSSSEGFRCSTRRATASSVRASSSTS